MSDLFSPGTQVNRFVLESEVGRGGMGIVYRALDPVLKRHVALKVLAPHLGSDAAALARFHREAELVAALKHSHIAIVYEFGEYEQHPYIAMEWIEGRTLKSLLAETGTLPLERSLHLFHQIASALDYAHQRGVIHRDLKPSNILIDADDHATIVDFGLAWLDTAQSITITGSVMGTPRYMSPEQIEGGTVDARSDVYSLGIILYEMLAGTPPFDAPTPTTLFHQQLFTPPTPITEMNPAVPSTVEAALEKALQKKPADRFASAREFQLALQPETVTNLPAPPRRPVATRRWIIAAAVAIAVLAGGFFRLNGNPFAVAERHTPTETPFAPTATPIPPTVAPTPTKPISNQREWGRGVRDPLRLNFAEIYTITITTDPQWVSDIESDESASLLSGDEFLIVTAPDGLVKAVNRFSGEDVWETRLGANVSAAPTLLMDGDTESVFFPTADGALYALHVPDAQLLWRIGGDQLQGVIRGLTLDYSAPIIAVTDSGLAHRINPWEGTLDQTLADTGQTFVHPPALNDTALFLAADSIQTVERVTAQTVWQTELPAAASASPLGDGGWGYVTIGTEGGDVLALSSLSGQTVWETKLSAPITDFAANWGNLFALAADGTVYAWQIWEHESRPLWVMDLETPITAGAVTTPNVLIVGTEDGQVIFLNAETGEFAENRTLYFDEPVRALLLTDDGWLYLRTDGQIFGFAPE